jgi:hypothetical protein
MRDCRVVSAYPFPDLPAAHRFFLTRICPAAGDAAQAEVLAGLRGDGSSLLTRGQSLGRLLASLYEDSRGEVGEYIATTVRNTAPALVLGTMDRCYFPPPLIDWHLITRKEIMTIHQAGSLGQIEEERRLALFLEHSWAPAWFIDAILPVLTGSDRPAMSRTLYLGLPENASYSLNQEELSLFLEQTFARTPCRSVVVVTSLSDKTRYPLSQIALTLQKADMRLLSAKLFHKAGARVGLYEARLWSPPFPAPNSGRLPEAR